MKSTRDTIHDELRHRLTSGRYPQDASLVLLERDGLLVGTEAIRDGDAEAARLRVLEHHEHDRDTRIRQKVRRDTGGGPAPD
ncbi:hypothetical protein [Streptomyces fuscichromogenes]|uniref:Uncharacterized protein n=1 Tax=Streptomyces fuscichromogenes TaxID=1324013 RepID=A0A917X9H8_9ACTN|nr:hypothetical protein [Streptomyces fuscichromogenes]GGM95477.1 hypothetical protein GCM10011578_014890 [Streptomyces fuscichromogenes]